MKLIPPNHKVFFPRYLCFVDTESNLAKEDIERYSEHTLKLGVAIYVTLDKKAQVVKREVCSFNTANEFWGQCTSHCLKNQTLTVYGHNLKYDAINLNTMDELSGRGYEIPYPILNHKFIMRAYKIVNKKRCYKIKLVDTANFIMISLKEIGKRFGLEKKEIDFSIDDIATMIDYCTRDTEIVEKFILSYIQFLVTNNLGSFKDTLASTSSSIYRHSFLEEIWYHADHDLLAFERNAYFGGRAECFFKGDLPVQDYVLYDVKSMYPYIMKTKKLPYKHIGTYHTPDIDFINELITNDKYVIAHCIIQTSDEITPYPVRYMNEDNEYPYTSTLLFPHGKFEAYLHLPELLYAIQNKHLVSIIQVEVYEQKVIFARFVNYFYDIKETTKDNSERELSKLNMNSLYGWFAKRDYKTVPLDIPLDFTSDVINWNMKLREDGLGYAIQNNATVRKTFHAWFGKLYRVTADALTPVTYGNVAIAGAITAYARIYLFDILKACGRSNLFYCDTDSVVTNREGEKLITQFVGDKIGQLEKQTEFDCGIIHCPKDYVFANQYDFTVKARLKGVSRIHRKLDDNHYEMLHFTSFKDYMNTGKHGTITLDKSLKRTYNKGVVKSDGFIDSPIVEIKDGINVRTY